MMGDKKMKALRAFLALLVLALAVPAFGAVAILDVDDADFAYGGCYEWTLCDDESSAQTCGGSGNERIVRPPVGLWFWTAWVDESTSNEAWTVKMYDKARGAGFDATDRTLLNGSGDMTISNMKYYWTGHMGDMHAVIGGTNTGDVRLKIRGCYPFFVQNP